MDCLRGRVKSGAYLSIKYDQLNYKVAEMIQDDIAAFPAEDNLSG